MFNKIFISTLLATSFISNSYAFVTLINNGNNPVLWGNIGKEAQEVIPSNTLRTT